ncbi:hypothetical protein NSS64_18380 [Paenibacillus sp. FSL H8-0122]
MIIQYLGETEVKPGQKLPMITEIEGEAPDQHGDFDDAEDEEDEEA